MTALAQVANRTAAKIRADICLYDVGPNVCALNRCVLLDCDYFITPVAADLFSLRALSTVGRSVGYRVRPSGEGNNTARRNLAVNCLLNSSRF